MFSLEILFHESSTKTESLLVQRSQVIIGYSDNAHVIVDTLKRQQVEIELSRGVGREFSCHCLPAESASPFVEGAYQDIAELDLGDTTLIISALDLDLVSNPDVSPDKEALRVIKKALCTPPPEYPALALNSERPVCLSFDSEQSVVVGRGKSAELRIDSNEISSEHARFGFEEGTFWVEDLGSTNGTYVANKRISGRRFLETKEHVRIGVSTEVFCLANGKQAEEFFSSGQLTDASSQPESGPFLISNYSDAKPEILEIHPGMKVSIGREPVRDFWVGAGHISREHCLIEITEENRVFIQDTSSNGTFVNEIRLPSLEEQELPARYTRISLGQGVEMGLCFGEEDKERFFRDLDKSEITRERHPTSVDLKSMENRVEREWNEDSRANELQGAVRADVLAESIVENNFETDNVSTQSHFQESEVTEAQEPDDFDDLYGDVGAAPASGGTILRKFIIAVAVIGLMALLYVLARMVFT